MKEVLEMAQDENFRSFVYKRALLQNSGDYELYLDDIVKGFDGDQKFGKSASKLQSLSSKIMANADGLRPRVFFSKSVNSRRCSQS